MYKQALGALWFLEIGAARKKCWSVSRGGTVTLKVRDLL